MNDKTINNPLLDFWLLQK